MDGTKKTVVSFY